MNAAARFERIIRCPTCGKPVKIDTRHRHYVDSVQRIGCDECLRRLSRAYLLSTLVAQIDQPYQAA